VSKRYGRSAYLSSFEHYISSFIVEEGSEYDVFTSFHIHEEYVLLQEDYKVHAAQLIERCHAKGYRVIADISPRTLEYLSVTSIEEFLTRYPVDVIRPDFGFTVDSIKHMATLRPLMLNASSQQHLLLPALAHFPDVSGLHNFYPRKDTGLDSELFQEFNAPWSSGTRELYAFVASQQDPRGPIHEGLPTLEHHRSLSPYVAAVDLWFRYNITGVLLGDLSMSTQDEIMIQRVLRNSILSIPAILDSMYDGLYNQTFTVREDSPENTLRLLESRQYATAGSRVEPLNTLARPNGSITIDNIDYKRYSGEIQIIRRDHGPDPRVNVIGHVDSNYLSLLPLIPRGFKISFVPPNS
jgi:hypothetical protein